MSLFKYLPPERIGVLNTLTLRYSPPAALNDPFEAKPFYTGFAPAEEMAQHYPRRYAQVLSDQYLSMPEQFRREVTYEAFTANCEHMRSEIYEIFRQSEESMVPKINSMMSKSFGEGLGVLCLSEKKECPLMWSHYAAGHRGFVLELDPSHSYFSDRKANPNDIWGLGKIVYSDTRPRTTIIEFDTQAMLLTKHLSWQYEREWKDFRPLKEASSIIEAKPFPIHLFEIPPASLRRVILGSRIPREERRTYLKALNENSKLDHVDLVRAVVDPQTFDIRFRPTPLRPGRSI